MAIVPILENPIRETLFWKFYSGEIGKPKADESVVTGDLYFVKHCSIPLITTVSTVVASRETQIIQRTLTLHSESKKFVRIDQALIKLRNLFHLLVQNFQFLEPNP